MIAASHTRVQLCALCESEPAKIFCKNDDAFLCENCDAEIHLSNPLAARHERVPLGASGQPLQHAPAVTEAPPLVPVMSPSTSIAPPQPVEATQQLAVPTTDVKLESTLHVSADNAKEGKFLDVFDIDGTFFDMGFDFGTFECNDILASNTPSDGVVPTCGPAESATSSAAHSHAPACNHGVSSAVESGLFSMVTDRSPDSEDKSSYGPFAKFVPCMVPLGDQAPQSSSAGFEVPSTTIQVVEEEFVPREVRVMRYREKRKKRVFEKTIRYASRKAYAEIRPRIKGRFAKREEVLALKVAKASGHDMVVPVL